jgi:hypothetical protein
VWTPQLDSNQQLVRLQNQNEKDWRGSLASTRLSQHTHFLQKIHSQKQKLYYHIYSIQLILKSYIKYL